MVKGTLDCDEREEKKWVKKGYELGEISIVISCYKRGYIDYREPIKANMKEKKSQAITINWSTLYTSMCNRVKI